MPYRNRVWYGGVLSIDDEYLINEELWCCMPHLHLSLLGLPQILLDDVPVRGLTRRLARALLIYLVVEQDRPHAREGLAGDLFGPTSRQLLRQALLELRRALGDKRRQRPVLLVTRETLRFDPAGDQWVDVATFGQLMALAETHFHLDASSCPPCARWLSEAVAL